MLDYNARQYDPALGRFVSADTIIPDTANPQDFNRYAYVRNNPLRYTDPTGHFTDPQIAEFTGFDEKHLERDIPAELLKLLRLMHFGDTLYLEFENYLAAGCECRDNFLASQKVWLAGGRLTFGNLSIHSLIHLHENESMKYMLTRTMGGEGGETVLLYMSDGFGDAVDSDQYPSLSGGSFDSYGLWGGADYTLTRKDAFLRTVSGALLVELSALALESSASKMSGKSGAPPLISLGIGVGLEVLTEMGLLEPGAGKKAGDRAMMYGYSDWLEGYIIRDGEIIYHEWAPRPMNIYPTDA